jgi:hypothetical protein
MHVNGTDLPASPSESEEADGAVDGAETTALVPAAPTTESGLATPAAASTSSPPIKVDPGLYAVLGLDPSVRDVDIQTAYRRQAAKVLGSGANDVQALKQLNVAYEVLGNPVRRAEYDRLRQTQNLGPLVPTPIRPGPKVAARATRRRRPRHIVQQRYAGLGDVLVVVSVVGLAVLAGALLIPHLDVNLSALNAIQAVLPLSNSTRRVVDTPVATPETSAATPQAVAAATQAPTAPPSGTPEPTLASLFTGSSVTPSDPAPASNGPESIRIKLQREGKPAANLPVWSTVQYRTTQERWPATGAVQTDANGAATITFNIGGATPNYPVTVQVFAQVDDQQLSWSTSFTPR